MDQSVQLRPTFWMVVESGFKSRQGYKIYHFSTASRSARRPTRRPVQLAPGAHLLEG
jgi:hypothetical protein